ncbi:MAG: DUF4437 domain-containing protein [Pseudomonadota bacterium]|nr:DUF4437 domain-containing protein [Pseudomonadota bacterium]
MNLQADILVWLKKSDLVNIAADGVSIAYLWGDTSSVYGTLIKLPKGFKGSIKSNGDEFKAVVIKGSLNYTQNNTSRQIELNAGSYIESSTAAHHSVENANQSETIVYVRTSSKFSVAD